jgi:hypothetical protein
MREADAGGGVRGAREWIGGMLDTMGGFGIDDGTIGGLALIRGGSWLLGSGGRRARERFVE